MKIKGGNSKARRTQRREEAIQRQSARDSRTYEEQLKLVKKRPGESKKEKYRLVTLIEAAYKNNKKGK
jgi:hypothetical protein